MKIKLCTDINQSKKLAEILPLKSADMYYPWDIDSKSFLNIPIVKDDSYYVQGSIGCWSLAALFGVLPYPYIEQNYKGKWTCRVEHGNTTYLWEDSNPVDACYEMILKLNELNLL